MLELLNKIKIPALEIKHYGSQITIECKSLKSCKEWGQVLAKFSKVKGIVESQRQKESSKGCKPEYYKVYRIYATI